MQCSALNTAPGSWTSEPRAPHGPHQRASACHRRHQEASAKAPAQHLRRFVRQACCIAQRPGANLLKAGKSCSALATSRTAAADASNAAASFTKTGQPTSFCNSWRQNAGLQPGRMRCHSVRVYCGLSLKACIRLLTCLGQHADSIHNVAQLSLQVAMAIPDES